MSQCAVFQFHKTRRTANEPICAYVGSARQVGHQCSSATLRNCAPSRANGRWYGRLRGRLLEATVVLVQRRTTVRQRSRLSSSTSYTVRTPPQPVVSQHRHASQERLPCACFSVTPPVRWSSPLRPLAPRAELARLPILTERATNEAEFVRLDFLAHSAGQCYNSRVCLASEHTTPRPHVNVEHFPVAQLAG